MPDKIPVIWLFGLEVFETEEQEDNLILAIYSHSYEREEGIFTAYRGVYTVYATQSLPYYLKDKGIFLAFGTYSYSERKMGYYTQTSLSKLVEKIKVNKADAVLNNSYSDQPYFYAFSSYEGYLTYQPVFTKNSYTISSLNPPILPPLSTPGQFGHAYQTKLADGLVIKDRASRAPAYQQVVSLWYGGLRKQL